MSTDRDLLILASRAAGLNYTAENFAAPGEFAEGWGMVAGIGTFWNTLVDRGQALELAVKLNMLVDIDTHPAMNFAEALIGHRVHVTETTDGALDPVAATCRAITRAAAAIGATLPE